MIWYFLGAVAVLFMVVVLRAAYLAEKDYSEDWWC